MNWKSLPIEIKEIIMHYRYLYTCGYHIMAVKIQSLWRCYKTKIIISRFKSLRYLKDFREWNPNIYIFITRSKI